MNLSNEQDELFHQFANIRFSIRGTFEAISNQKCIEYPHFYLMNEKNEQRYQHMLQEDLTESLQHMLVRPIIVVKNEESYFVLFKDEDECYVLQLISSNGYEFDCSVGKYHHIMFFMPVKEKALLISYLQTFQRLLAEQPAYRMHDATGTLMFKEI